MPNIANKFGKIGGWNSVKINILGRTLEGVTDIDYSDEVEWENIYGAGDMPVGQGSGNYAAKVALTLLNEERLALLGVLPAGTKIQDIAAFSIVVSYDYNDIVYSDVIRNCRFKNNGVSVKSGDKSIAFKFDLVCSHIDYNV